MADKKVILVTGGTGTFGTEFVRQSLRISDRIIRVYSRGEFNQVKMQREYPTVRYLIGDVRDKDRLKRAMAGVNIVVHAAALKHVPVCEYNPIEAIRTNIDGSINVVDAAIDCGVEKVIAISSDKSVHPANLYGATKLVMEKFFLQANIYGDTKFSVCRFGNLHDSNGGVEELWREQMKNGVITITDKSMSRFFITKEEAVMFTIKCLAIMDGGEIFIPIMNQFTLEQLASHIAPEAKQQLIGRRSGEKIKEELYSPDEADRLERHPDYFVIRPLQAR